MLYSQNIKITYTDTNSRTYILVNQIPTIVQIETIGVIFISANLPKM